MLFAYLLMKFFFYLSPSNNMWLLMLGIAFVFFSLGLKDPAAIKIYISYACFVLSASVNLKILFALADKSI